MTCSTKTIRPSFAAACCIIVSLTGCSETQDPVASRDAKNVIIISIDTCRADHLSCYGYPRQTTAFIDSVASDGAIFARAQTTNPITLPAHCSLMTGTIPPAHGVRNNGNYRLHDSQQTLAEILRENGYQTAAFIGAFPLDARFGLDQGFDTYDDQLASDALTTVPERNARSVTRSAISWLDQHHDKPFFMFVHYFDPHFTYQPPEPFRSRFSEEPYAGEIAYVDNSLGELIDRLKAYGLYDSATIVITSDHGEGRDEHREATHGFFVYQSTLHVPLIIKMPGVKKNVKVGDPVSLIDVSPTILGTLDLEIPPQMLGSDLTGYLDGQAADSAPRSIYGESLVPTLLACAPLHSIVNGRWHYISSVKPELYDLIADPGELSNLADEAPNEVNALDEQLREIIAHQSAGHDRSTMQLDRQGQQHLESLGYLGGAVNETVDIQPEMNEAKDIFPHFQRLMTAEGLISVRRFDDAKRICLELLDDNIGALNVHLLLAGIADKQGNPAEALAHFYEALELAAVSESSLSREVEYLIADANNKIGSVLHRKGDLLGARKHIERAIRSYPDIAESRSNLAAVLVDMASRTNVPFKKKQFIAEAKTHIQQALELNPDDANVHNNFGGVLFAEGELVEAEKYYRRALEIDPEHRDANTNLELVRKLKNVDSSNDSAGS